MLELLAVAGVATVASASVAYSLGKHSNLKQGETIVSNWSQRNFRRAGIYYSGKVHFDGGDGNLGVVMEPFTAWKVVSVRSGLTIARLVIPSGARVHMTRKKCRASCAYVDKIKGSATEAHSLRYSGFEYHEKSMVIPQEEFTNQERRCESGIHFFKNECDAKKHLRRCS